MEFDEHVRFILGRPNFVVAKMAFLLIEEGLYARKEGDGGKAEDEQAIALHWLLTMYKKHGEDYLEKANAWCKEASSRRKAA